MNQQAFRVLIVEDGPRQRELRELLEGEGHNVKCARSVYEGLGRARYGDFDVVVTGLYLRSPSGLKRGETLISKLRATKPHLPIIKYWLIHPMLLREMRQAVTASRRRSGRTKRSGRRKAIVRSPLVSESLQRREAVTTEDEVPAPIKKPRNIPIHAGLLRSDSIIKGQKEFAWFRNYMADLQRHVHAHRNAVARLISSLRSYRSRPAVFEKHFEGFLQEIKSQIEQLSDLVGFLDYQQVSGESIIIKGQKEFARFVSYMSGLRHVIGMRTSRIIRPGISSLLGHRMWSERCEDDLRGIQSYFEEVLQTVREFQPGLLPSSPTGPVEVTAASLFEEARDLFSDLTKAQAIQLKCEPSGDIQFFCQRQQLIRVLTILIDNAADAIGQDGTITLRARRGKARLKKTRTEAVILEVEDTGPGIPAEVRERLFDPFFSTKSHGIGLGLATAAWIVAESGGAILCDTKLGHGTTFTVLLPASKKA